MKKSTKIISGILSLALVFTCGIGATLAYLQKTAAPVTNTFVAKDLIDNENDFVLKEHEAVLQKDETYKLNETETTANKYKVVPGATLPKDPFVRVKVQENAYLFVEVENKLATGMSYTVDTENWEETTLTGKHGGKVYVRLVNNAEAANEYVLEPTVPAKEVTFKILAPETISVLPTFNPKDATGEVALNFYGYLSQADGFSTPEASWAATFGAN